MPRRRFHLVAVTTDLGRTLAIQTAAGWLLPWLDDDPRTELPAQVEAALRRVAGTSEMVHEAPLASECVSDDVRHAACVALIADPLESRDEGLAAVPHAALMAAPALIPLQRQAWLQAIGRLRAPIAPFDSGAQVRSALAWAEEQAAAHTQARVLTAVRHRCTRYEYVVRLDTTDGVVYLKAGPERAADEGVLTDLLWKLSPRHFPETLALDIVRHRWLYRELPGELLLGPHLTEGAAAAAVRALAVVQKRALDAPLIERHLACRRLRAVDLFVRADAIVADAWSGSAATSTSSAVTSERSSWRSAQGDVIDAWRAVRPVLGQACEELDRLGLPLTLVLSDFWPRNILVTPDGIGFIDVEQSYWSYPFLSLARFLREIERMLRVGPARIVQAFTEAWADVVSPTTMARGLSFLPIVEGLFATLLVSRESDLQAQGLGTALPDRCRKVSLVPLLRRLVDEARRWEGRTVDGIVAGS